jgi:pimeloyl-ACP methyl ester carboxylesterase
MPEGRQSIEQVAGCRVSLLRGGFGPPLLYLHGAGGAGRWMPFMEALSSKFDVLVPEHPGFGESETPAWLDNVHDLAYFYLDFLDALGLDKVHLVGNSIGGWIASELAVRDPHRLRTLTLISPAGIRVEGVPTGDIFLWSQPELTRNLYFDADLAESLLKVSLGEKEQDTFLRNRVTSAKLAWQPRLYDPHLAKWLHRINLPTLIVWGDSDKVIPPAYGSAFRQLIPGARLEIFPRCSHLPHVEKASEFVALLTRFLEETGK